MSAKQMKQRRESPDRRRTYSAPRILEEQSFEREALALCDKGTLSCTAGGGSMVGAS